MNIIGTGLSGLVGSRVVELLSPFHTFVNYSLENGVDITRRNDIVSRITGDSKASWVVHLAAYTNVQQAEHDRNLKEQSDAWKVNVDATQYIIDACTSSGKRLLYVDTDYAFDGTRKTYTEEDVPNPRGWYAITKSEGARRVLALGESGLVVRISNPYRAHPVGKKDFVHKMLERIQSGQEILAPADQLFVPTFVDDIAKALNVLMARQAFGVYHAVGSQVISPFDAAQTVARVYGCDGSLVKQTTFAAYFGEKAPVPQYAVLANEKISALGIRMSGFADGLAEVYWQETGQA